MRMKIREVLKKRPLLLKKRKEKAMVNSVDILQNQLMRVGLLDDVKDYSQQNRDSAYTGYRKNNKHAVLDAELKKKIRQNIYDWNFVENILKQLTPEALIELESFLWDEAMQYGETVLQQKLTREFITSKMEPTSTYHHRQGCREPLIACRANYCILSNPNCASNKIKQQIKALATVFERRHTDTRYSLESVRKYFCQFIKKNNLVGMILTTATGVPIAAASEFDINNENLLDHSEFVKLFFQQLNDYIHSEANTHSIEFDIHLKAISQKITINEETLILTLISALNNNLDVALFQATFGIARIMKQVHALAS